MLECGCARTHTSTPHSACGIIPTATRWALVPHDTATHTSHTHALMVTHLNGDKEPTCFVVFKYEWGEFATSEVVSDETGAALPTAWVNWYAPYPSCL